MAIVNALPVNVDRDAIERRDHYWINLKEETKNEDISAEKYHKEDADDSKEIEFEELLDSLITKKKTGYQDEIGRSLPAIESRLKKQEENSNESNGFLDFIRKALFFDPFHKEKPYPASSAELEKELTRIEVLKLINQVELELMETSLGLVKAKILYQSLYPETKN